jgi:hypothetical protein
MNENLLDAKGAILVMTIVCNPAVHTIIGNAINSVPRVLVAVREGVYTPEQLEDLAASEAAARYHLPNARLEVLGAKHKPPQTWYDEDFSGLY